MKLNPEETQVLIEEAVRLARTYMAADADRAEPVLRHTSPAELIERLDLSPPRLGCSLEELLADIRTTLEYSPRTSHPGFSNQLFGDRDPAGIVGEWMTSILNTSMYTFEVAPVVTLMEQALMRHMCELVGWPADEGEGVITPGGSIANLMAVLAARNQRLPDAKARGLEPSQRLALLMSEEGHYSVERAASVVGLGTDSVCKVAVDGVGRMDPAATDAAVQRELGDGRTPFFLCATASTTVAGAFDPLEELAEVARRHGLWLHVDAACGGGVLVSRKHRDLMRGCEHADSVTWDPHKLMGVPLTCSALLVRERGRLASTNAMGADYLFHGGADSSYDTGDVTLQCGRRVDALKLWLSWRALGDDGHGERIDRLFDVAARLREMIAERPTFEPVREPEGLNTCFHFVPADLRGTPPSAARTQRLGELTVAVRERLLTEGRLMINYAPLDGVPVFRHVANNQQVTDQDLELLLDEIERLGAAC